MLKQNKNTIRSNSIDNKISGAVKIKAGSFIIDNQWVSYDSYLFRINEYINSVLTANRTRFFDNRFYAVYLVVTLSLRDGIKIIEGEQVKYTTREAVPLPKRIDTIPLVGIIIRQNGSDDLNTGYTSIKDDDLRFFSGTGNIIDKNMKGITGLKNTVQGLTGLQGSLGETGYIGITGKQGNKGFTGLTGELIQGETGLQGMTGISWEVHLPFYIE